MQRLVFQQGQADRQLMLERHADFLSGAKKRTADFDMSRNAGGPASIADDPR